MDQFIVTTRDFTLNDLDAIVSMEANVFPFPWNRGDFEGALKPGESCDLIVSTVDDQIVGYCIVDVGKTVIEIIKLMVVKEKRRMGIGTAILRHVMEKVWACQELVYHVRERDLESQKLLKKHGLTAVVERNHFENQNIYEYDGKSMPIYREDSYRFSSPARTTSQESSQFSVDI